MIPRCREGQSAPWAGPGQQRGKSFHPRLVFVTWTQPGCERLPCSSEDTQLAGCPTHPRWNFISQQNGGRDQGKLVTVIRAEDGSLRF